MEIRTLGCRSPPKYRTARATKPERVRCPIPVPRKLSSCKRVSRNRSPEPRLMPSNSRTSIRLPATLFQLKSLDGDRTSFARPCRIRRRSQIGTVRARTGKHMTLFQDDATSRLLRIDQGDSDCPSPASPIERVERVERRLSRLTGAEKTKSENASSQPYESATDWLGDHIGDLIHNLKEWSIRLDRREADLDYREQQLNQRLRFLRQNSCAE